MPRRYYRRRSGNRDKYSIESTILYTPLGSEWPEVAATETTQKSRQFSALVVPSIDAQGMRKVKHLTMTFSAEQDTRVLYALVFVPSGYEVNPVRNPILGQSGSLYEPNQFVMSSGVLDFSGGPLRISTPLSRNLNSGDAIYIVFSSNSTSSLNTTQITGTRTAPTPSTSRATASPSWRCRCR